MPGVKAKSAGQSRTNPRWRAGGACITTVYSTKIFAWNSNLHNCCFIVTKMLSDISTYIQLSKNYRYRHETWARNKYTILSKRDLFYLRAINLSPLTHILLEHNKESSTIKNSWLKEQTSYVPERIFYRKHKTYLIRNPFHYNFFVSL